MIKKTETEKQQNKKIYKTMKKLKKKKNWNQNLCAKKKKYKKNCVLFLFLWKGVPNFIYYNILFVLLCFVFFLLNKGK